MATTDFYTLAKPLQPDQRLEEERHAATGRLSVAGDKAEAEPEVRLWKVCAEAVSSQFTALEFVAFLLFGVLSLGAVAYCVSELFQLLTNSALDQAVRVLLTR
jgi:hypothetical protein